MRGGRCAPVAVRAPPCRGGPAPVAGAGGDGAVRGHGRHVAVRTCSTAATGRRGRRPGLVGAPPTPGPEHRDRNGCRGAGVRPLTAEVTTGLTAEATAEHLAEPTAAPDIGGAGRVRAGGRLRARSSCAVRSAAELSDHEPVLAEFLPHPEQRRRPVTHGPVGAAPQRVHRGDDQAGRPVRLAVHRLTAARRPGSPAARVRDRRGAGVLGGRPGRGGAGQGGPGVAARARRGAGADRVRLGGGTMAGRVRPGEPVPASVTVRARRHRRVGAAPVRATPVGSASVNAGSVNAGSAGPALGGRTRAEPVVGGAGRTRAGPGDCRVARGRGCDVRPGGRGGRGPAEQAGPGERDRPAAAR